jgi:ribonuclease HI
MNAHLLFTDGSVNPPRRIGVGVALLVPADWLDRKVDDFAAAEVASHCHMKRFAETSSTQLELDTVLWALNEIAPGEGSLTLCTDSQCVVGLPARRQRLEAAEFVSGGSDAELRHADRYREFFRRQDARAFTLMKLTGHADFRYQDAAQRIFHFVDREARRQLKRWLRELERQSSPEGSTTSPP